nr:replication protein A 70 kDa DNA-binding subunit B-like [Ipomoea batatas]
MASMYILARDIQTRNTTVAMRLRLGIQLKCTVWDQHVEKVMPFFKSDLTEAVIVLIQMCRVKPASAHVTEEGGVVIEEKEDGCKVAGVVISSNNHQLEKEICSIPCSSKQQKAINAKEPEQCVTPKRRGIGVLDTEKIIAQFSKEMTAIIQKSIEKKERKGKGGGTEGFVSAQARVKDVSEGSEKGERGFKNTMEWVKVVEELMKKDKGFDQKVKEALKEVNTYLWTVYDKKKEEYVEEGRNRAMRAATIFLVKVKLCPSWNRENGMLGKYLKANIDAVGARICHWAVTLNL